MYARTGAGGSEHLRSGGGDNGWKRIRREYVWDRRIATRGIRSWGGKKSGDRPVGRDAKKLQKIWRECIFGGGKRRQCDFRWREMTFWRKQIKVYSEISWEIIISVHE